MRPPLSGTLLPVCCVIFFPFGVRIQFPAPRVVSQNRVQIPDLGSQAPLPPTPGLRSILPHDLLDFLGEVLGHDATFLLLLLVFAWKGEQGHRSAHLHPLGIHFLGLDLSPSPTPASPCGFGLDLEASVV